MKMCYLSLDILFFYSKTTGQKWSLDIVIVKVLKSRFTYLCEKWLTKRLK